MSGAGLDESEQIPETLDGLVVTADAAERISQIEIGVQITRIDQYGALETFDRLAVAQLNAQRLAEIVVERSGIGTHCRRSVVGSDRLTGLATQLQGITEIKQCLERIGIARHAAR